MQIFAAVDDIGLMNLAENSSRFGIIAKMELNERYMNKYFKIDNVMHGSSKTYKDFIELFCCEIKSIEAIDSDRREDYRWIESLLRKAKKLTKLRLEIKSLVSNEQLLEQYTNANITDLTLCTVSNFYPVLVENPFMLSKFRSLKKFAIENFFCISIDSFTEVIHNNPALESLFVGATSCIRITDSFPFETFIELIGMNLKQLKELAYVP